MASSTRTGEKSVQASVKLSEGVTASLENGVLTIKGPLGTCSKDFSKIPIDLSLQGRAVTVSPYGNRRRDVAVTNTARSHVRNMVEGVTKGYEYRLKIVYAHFPVSAKVKGDELHIENFYGERAPRVAKIVGACKVSVEGDDVVVRGVSKDDVGQTAANIEQATTITKKDQRIFLDGVYMYEKRTGWQ